MKKLQKYLVDTLTLSSDTKMTLGKKRLSTTAVQSIRVYGVITFTSYNILIYSLLLINKPDKILVS